jgi:hypothetical protein
MQEYMYTIPPITKIVPTTAVPGLLYQVTVWLILLWNTGTVVA